ncbi:MAG: hypothetical protein JJE13_00375 [Thermoleophilia bacterium]|nr:hypothetical protein [Thermoleophilia bacterium]
MGSAARLASFAGLVALVLVSAAYAGSRIDPSVDAEPGRSNEMKEMTRDSNPGEAASPGHVENTILPGLSVADRGYDLRVDRPSLNAGRPARLVFSIETGGSNVTEFDLTHERRMHLILVRRDFQGFQHLHPNQKANGSWSVTSAALAPGVYRMFADFSVGGESLTLATDLFVEGEFVPKPLGPVSRVADAGDGYEVESESAVAAGGATVPAEFTVRRNGKPVDDIEPYLGADGHLVALREGDQAFLHTHPEGAPGGSGPIRFQVEYPTAGRYRLYLQFRHRGSVHTAEFTQIAGEAEGGPEVHEVGDH